MRFNNCSFMIPSNIWLYYWVVSIAMGRLLFLHGFLTTLITSPSPKQVVKPPQAESNPSVETGRDTRISWSNIARRQTLTPTTWVAWKSDATITTRNSPSDWFNIHSKRRPVFVSQRPSFLFTGSRLRRLRSSVGRQIYRLYGIRPCSGNSWRAWRSQSVISRKFVNLVENAPPRLTASSRAVAKMISSTAVIFGKSGWYTW